jgi:hypothetical protein
MPRRTPVGAELLRRVNGFRAYLQTAGADRADALHADRFSPDLPYAIVFGLTEQWARTVELVGAPPQTPWFYSRGPYTPHRFGARMALFSSSSAATLTTPPPPPPVVSGSSGFGSGGSGSWAAAPRAAAVVEAAAAPGEPTSRARPMHCRAKGFEPQPPDP